MMSGHAAAGPRQRRRKLDEGNERTGEQKIFGRTNSRRRRGKDRRCEARTPPKSPDHLPVPPGTPPEGIADTRRES